MVLVISPVVFFLFPVIIGLLLLLAHCVLGCRLHPLQFLAGEFLRSSLLLTSAKSYLPRGRTMTRSDSRGASPALYALSEADKIKSAAAAHYQPLEAAKYPDSVRALGPSVSRGYNNSSPDISSSRLVGASARGKSVGRDNGSDVEGIGCSVRICSREQSVGRNEWENESEGAKCCSKLCK